MGAEVKEKVEAQTEESKEEEEHEEPEVKSEVKFDTKLLEDPHFLAWCLREITGKTLEELAEMFDTTKGTLSRKFRQWEKDENMRKLKKKYIPYVEKLFVGKDTRKTEKTIMFEPTLEVSDERLDKLEAEVKELKHMMEQLQSIVLQTYKGNIGGQNKTNEVSQGVASKHPKIGETMPDLSNLRIRGDVDVNNVLADVKSDISEIKQIMKLGVLTQWYIYAKDKGIPIKGVFDVEELLFGEKPPVMSEEEEEKDIEELLQRVKR